MKILIGDGIKVEIRDVGKVIYTMHAKNYAMLPFHGSKIMSDEDAREFIKNNKHLSYNKTHV